MQGSRIHDLWLYQQLVSSVLGGSDQSSQGLEFTCLNTAVAGLVFLRIILKWCSTAVVLTNLSFNGRWQMESGVKSSSIKGSEQSKYGSIMYRKYKTRMQWEDRKFRISFSLFCVCHKWWHDKSWDWGQLNHLKKKRKSFKASTNTNLPATREILMFKTWVGILNLYVV